MAIATRIRRRLLLAATALLLALAGPALPGVGPSVHADGGTEQPAPILVPRDWGLIPRGMPEGGEFRLLVVTDSMRDSRSTDIADYDAHVQEDLGASGAHPDIRQYADLFRVVGSTATVAARDHIEAGPEHEPGVAIYWLNGKRVSESYGGFFSGSWQSYEARLNDGRTIPTSQRYGFYIATGSTNAGTTAFVRELGTRQQHYGRHAVAYGVLSAGDVLDYYLLANSVPPDAARPFYAISPVFRVMNDGVPHTVSVAITSDAGSDNDYGAGDTIRATVTFNEAVTVTGQPVLSLRFGRDDDHKAPYASEVVDAAYVASASTATELVFDYTVTADDMDNDGLSIGRGAIRLNGGSITKQNASTRANVYNRLLRDQPEHMVNQVPFARRPQMLSRPRASSDEYGLGELVEFVVPFSEPVEVKTDGGRPYLRIQIGHLLANADYLRTQGSRVIFGHVVAERQIDIDGVRAKKNGIRLNGSTIRSLETGRDATLTFKRIDFASHMVDAGLTPPASSHARLASFGLSGVSLRPAFDPDVTEYMGAAPNSTSETTVHVLPFDSVSVVTHSHADANSEASGRQVALAVGDTTITVTVIASDQRSTKTYTIRAMRSMAGSLSVVSIAGDEESVVEGTPAIFTLTRSAPLDEALVVALDVSQTGTVLATDDTYEPPTEVTFAAGSATATLSVRTQSDRTDEPDGAIKAMLMPKIHYDLGESDSAQVTLSDDDDTPIATLQLNPASIAENGGVSTVTATLDRPSSAETTITLSAAPVAPAAGSDFARSLNSGLSIPAGETTSVGTVTITASDNFVGNANKTVTVSASATNAHGVNPPSSVTLTITDDESAPAAPMHLTATPGDAEVTLSWDAPDAAADITRHEYRHRLAGNQYTSTWEEITDSAPGGASEDGVTVTGLTNGRTYDFQVRAVSDAGTSEPSMDASAFAGAGHGICDRTGQVRTRLLSLIADVSDCADVTTEHLNGVAGTVKIADSDLDSLKAGDFDGLTMVTELFLYNQNFTSLPDGLFSDMASLEVLDLHYNDISAVSAATFQGLTTLRELDLSHNELYEIEDSTFAGLTSLQTLELFSNHLPGITAQMFDGLTSLTTLHLSDNWISTIEAGSFEDLSSLTTLTLSTNQIVHWFPNMLAGLESIKRLWLDVNPMKETTVHSPFVDLSTLEYLNVDFGQIRFHFAPGMFTGLESLQTLSAMANWRVGNVLPLHVRLEVDDDDTIRMIVPAGAPFDIVAEVEVENGSLEDGATTITVERGKTTSDGVAVTRTTGTTGPVRVRFGEIPSIPTGDPEEGIPPHAGYGLDPMAGNPSLEVIPALPAVRLSLAPSAVLEQDDTATTDVNEALARVTATLEEPVDTPLTVSVSVSVSAVSPATDDSVTLSGNVTLSFAANATTSTGAVTITAVDDDAATGDRAYTVSGTLSAAVADGPSPLTLTIHDDEPPPAPTGLSAVAGDGELRLQWKAPAPDDGIDGYEYRYREDSAADYPATWSSVGDGYRGYSDGSSRRGYRVRGLTNDVAYRVQVRAVNMAGAGGAAATSDATTPLEPPRVELTLSRTTITEQDDPLTPVNESVATVTATVTRAVSVPFTVTVTATDSSRYVFSADRLLSFAADSTTSTGVVTLSAVPSTASEPDVTVTVSADVSAAGLAAEVAAPEGVALTIVDDENMAPTSTDATVSTAEDTGYVFQASDFPFSDGDTGDALASVGILDLPRSGALRFGDAALSEGYKIAASELGELIFAPAPNAHGSGYASFRFTVSDGEASSTVTSTMTIAVTEVNDPPLFEGASTLSAMEGQTDAGLVVAGDVDRGDSVHYAITGGADSDAFAIDAGSGRLTFTTAPDFDSPSDQASTSPANAAGNNEYVVVITATGGSGPRALTAEATFIVAVAEAVETPGGEREVSSVTITSAPGDDGFYAAGDVVTIEVTFSGVVAVEPTPRVGVGLSTTTANDSESILSAGSACYASGSGAASLVFRYAVREGQQGRLVARALVADDEGEPGTGTIYSGTMDNVADLAFEATAAVDSQAVDGVRPVLASSRIAEDRLTIILKFSENLSATTAPASAFTVTVGAETAAVSSVAASGREVTLTLASAVGSGERVDVAYSEPTENTQPPADEVCGLDFAGDDANAVQDVAGNDARSFGVVVDPGAAPLTATFVDMPAEHDGRATFSFRLSFSEAIATGYVWVRDTAMNVSGGSVTSVHRVQGRSDLWNVTVQPSGRGDVAVTLPARTPCSNPNTAVCTRDKRPLSAGITAAVAGPPGEPEPLTAAFTSIPREHDGATPFSVRIQFSSPISVSFVTLEERSVTAANGAVTAARRVDGQSDFWEVDIAPDWYQDVTITLAADEGCGGANAVCTSDARALANAPSITIKSRPQPWLSIGDASADEGPGATLTFRVTLSHAAPVPVTVDYATTNGRATAGEDYTATSGTLTFAPGELTGTVSVTVLDDSDDEGSSGVEAMRLLLTSATGASIRDDAGVGYIRDTN